MGTIAHLPRTGGPRPPHLHSEPAVEAALEALVDAWPAGPDEGLAARRELLRQSGLTAITLAEAVGGLDCSNRSLAGVLRRLETLDREAAEALHRHVVALERVRAEGDPALYADVAGTVRRGDLYLCAASEGLDPLHLPPQDFHRTATGRLMSSKTVLWADWISARATRGTVESFLEGFADEQVILPLGAAQVLPDPADPSRLSVAFDGVPAVAVFSRATAGRAGTAEAIDWLLEAARWSATAATPAAETAFRPALRRKLRCRALFSLVLEAGDALDRAQVDPTAEVMAEAVDLCRQAALLSADVSQDEARFDALLTG